MPSFVVATYQAAALPVKKFCSLFLRFSAEFPARFSATRFLRPVKEFTVDQTVRHRPSGPAVINPQIQRLAAAVCKWSRKFSPLSPQTVLLPSPLCHLATHTFPLELHASAAAFPQPPYNA
jgi:hypothetical protein